MVSIRYAGHRTQQEGIWKYFTYRKFAEVDIDAIIMETAGQQELLDK